MWLVLFHSNCVFLIFYVRTGKSQQATEARYLRDQVGGPQDRNEPVARRGVVVVVSRLSVVALFWVRKLTA